MSKASKSDSRHHHTRADESIQVTSKRLAGLSRDALRYDLPDKSKLCAKIRRALHVSERLNLA